MPSAREDIDPFDLLSPIASDARRRARAVTDEKTTATTTTGTMTNESRSIRHADADADAVRDEAMEKLISRVEALERV